MATRRLKGLLVIAAASVLLAHAHEGQAQPAAGTILVDGGFEEEGEQGLPRGWKIMPNLRKNGKAGRDTAHTHSGQFSLKLSPGERNTQEGYGVFLSLPPDAIQGKTVTVSGYARLNGMGASPAALLLKTDTPNWLVLPQAVQNRFFSFRKTFVISKVIPEASLCFFVGGNTGSAWLDDVAITVEAGPAPAGAQQPTLLKPSTDRSVHKINTAGWQDSAFISPSGRELYFAYMPYTGKDFMDVFLGRIREADVKVKGPIRPGSRSTMLFETYRTVKNAKGGWETPQRVQVQGDPPLYAAKLSRDGKELYYAMRDRPGAYGSGDIFMSTKRADGTWSRPKNLGPQVNTGSNEDTPFLSADGSALYFARNTGDALGWEIFVSRKKQGEWGRAERLGLPINERHPETTANHQPFITADGKEFYFTRIQQLYRSIRRADGTWGHPLPVFPDLPVSGHGSVTADGRYLYFLTAKDRESLNRENWTIWYSERTLSGGWSPPQPVD